MTQRYVNTASTAGGDGTTNNTTGATRAYASLSEWEAAEQTTLTDDHTVDCCGSTADTTAVTIDGWITGSYDIVIRGNEGETDGRHDGVFSTSHYRLSVDANTCLTLIESDTTIRGIQVNNARAGDVLKRGIYCVSAVSNVYWDSVITRQESSTTDTASDGLVLNHTGTTQSGIINCIVYNWGGNGINLRANSASPNQVFGYSNTVVDCNAGCRSEGGNVLWKNNLLFGNTSAFTNTSAADTTNSTNNAADDSAANIPGGNSVDLTSYAGTDIFTDYSGDDFHLSASGTGAAQVKDAGADLDGDSYFNVTADIDGDTRHATTPDIGADEYVGGASDPEGGLVGGKLTNGGILMRGRLV